MLKFFLKKEVEVKEFQEFNKRRRIEARQDEKIQEKAQTNKKLEK